MRRAMLLPIAFALLAAAPPAPALVGLQLTDGVFVEAGRIFAASAAYAGPCNGNGVLTVVIHKPLGDDVRVAAANSTMQPDPCDVYCTGGDCMVPFAWVLQSRGTLAGAGIAGADVASLQGNFQGGLLAFHSRPAG